MAGVSDLPTAATQTQDREREQQEELRKERSMCQDLLRLQFDQHQQTLQALNAQIQVRVVYKLFRCNKRFLLSRLFVCARACCEFYARACDLTVAWHVQVLTYKNKELHDILAQNGLPDGEGAVLRGQTSLESDA